MNSKGKLQSPPDAFVSPLLELRDYYAHLAEEYQRLFIQARSQLDHVDALLSTWSLANGHEEFSRLEAADEALTVAEESSLLFLSPDSTSEIDLVEPELANSKASPLPSKSSESHDNALKWPEVPMLPHYEGFTRMEAIKQLLEEYIGTVCHIDFIVRSLYGELEPHMFKVVKGRVQSSLTQGRERAAWSAIPNEPGCYTIDLSVLTPSNGNGASMGIRGKKKKPFLLPKSKVVPMLRAFEGQFLIDAITSFLEQNPGRIFSVAEIVNGIYGELDSQQIREVKNKVLNELSRGHRTGRFSRVPDKIGFYQY